MDEFNNFLKTLTGGIIAVENARTQGEIAKAQRDQYILMNARPVEQNVNPVINPLSTNHMLMIGGGVIVLLGAFYIVK